MAAQRSLVDPTVLSLGLKSGRDLTRRISDSPWAGLDRKPVVSEAQAGPPRSAPGGSAIAGSGADFVHDRGALSADDRASQPDRGEQRRASPMSARDASDIAVWWRCASRDSRSRQKLQVCSQLLPLQSQQHCTHSPAVQSVTQPEHVSAPQLAPPPPAQSAASVPSGHQPRPSGSSHSPCEQEQRKRSRINVVSRCHRRINGFGQLGRGVRAFASTPVEAPFHSPRPSRCKVVVMTTLVARRAARVPQDARRSSRAKRPSRP